MKNQDLRGGIFYFILFVLLMGGCVGQTDQAQDQPLEPRSAASQGAVEFVQEGNRLFTQKRFSDAVQKYEAPIQAQSSLGEPHYNLGLALYKRRLYSEARPHFETAAELAPDDHFGHQH